MTINADTTIVVDLLEAARATISGRVVDEDGVGVPGVVFSARLLPAGTAVQLQEDTTVADGSFVLALPVGQLELLLAPPAGTRLVGRRLDEVTVTEDAVWDDLVLAAGLQVTTNVTGPSGGPVAAADIDVFDLDTGIEIYTPRDNTDDTGQVAVIVPAGSYRVVVTPPAGSGLAVGEVSPVVVAADTVLDIELEFAAAVTGPVTLQASYPNPFNAVATVVYHLDAPTDVTLAVFDLRGRLVADLGGGPRTEGTHEARWDGTTAERGCGCCGRLPLAVAHQSGQRRETDFVGPLIDAAAACAARAARATANERKIDEDHDKKPGRGVADGSLAGDG